MTEGDLLVRKEGAVATITFNRPEVRNALSYEMWCAIPEALDRLAKDEGTRVAILRGAGKEAFAAGADISQFQSIRSDSETAEAYNRATEEAMRGLYEFGKPTIAMIYGHCMGGGCSIAAACDLRFASEGARFGIPAARLGIAYPLIGTRQMVNLIGPSFAKEMLFTGRGFTAQEALAMGFVNRILPEGELEDYVRQCASAIIENAPLSLAAAKLTINRVADGLPGNAAEEIAETVRRCLDSRDYKEGVAAFMEKRKPKFIGR